MGFSCIGSAIAVIVTKLLNNEILDTPLYTSGHTSREIFGSISGRNPCNVDFDMLLIKIVQDGKLF